ncbi:MAG TPA: hypothetical protein VGQ65_11310 [Thermoanaerobaculia bacterium]|nr:hypothetical protein [Thermoanaerobaculia bacterium]
MSTQIEVPKETSHTDGAQACVEDIRAMRQRIPNFVIPESKKAGQRLATVASIPKEFIELAAVAVKNSAMLVRGSGTDPAQIRDFMSFAEAYAPVADELEALAHFIRHSVALARNKAGSDALTTYALAQRLAKRAETAELAPLVNDMRGALGPRFRKAKAKQTTPTAPVPAPRPVTPASTV